MSTHKKRILIVCQHFWPESFRINDICDYLVYEQDCEIDVLCGIPNYPKGKFYEGYSLFKNRKQTRNGVSVRRTLEIPRGDNTNIRIFVNYISFPLASIFHIPRLLAKKYDKILLYQLSPVMMSFAGIVVGKIRKTETVMYVLDLWPENLFSVLDIKNKPLRNLVTHISHWHYKNTDKIIALSSTMKKKLVIVTAKPEDKIIVLPQACEKIYETALYDKELHQRFNKTFNVVFTGNISPAQSFDTIIRAAKKLLQDGITDVRWVIVGDGMSRSWLEEEVKKNNLENYFLFEGQHPIEDIPKYTDIADVLVGCLVKSELLEATIPAKVMSYIASAKPIVLAMDGEVQELINETIKCGFVSDTEDYISLASNIKHIYDLSPAERNKLGERARNYHNNYLERNIVLGKLFEFMFDDNTSRSNKV